MRFSIITATKNNKAGLLRAIECVRTQTYKNVEHIIVDGKSTDGSQEIIRSAQNDTLLQAQDDRLITTNYSLLTFSEADSGIYDAINKGIKLATGDVIGLLHSDDLYADEKVLERYAEAFAADFSPAAQNGIQRLGSKGTGQVDAVYSDLVYVKFRREVRRQKLVDSELKTTDDQLPATNYSIMRYWKAADPSTRLRLTKWLKNGWMPPHPTLFIRKELFDKYGLYRTDMKIAADYEMILRLFFKNKITAHYLPFTTYLMTIGGASNKSLKNIFEKSREDYIAMKQNGISFPLLTLANKNLRKLPQFLARGL